MPRRQRFKPSRKPKPAIEPSDQEVITKSPPQDEQQMSAAQHEHVHPDEAEERIPR